MDAFDALLRETLLVTAVLALPVVSLAALVGTTLAVLQAATQVQEQTIALLPKIVVVGLTVALFGSFAMRLVARLFGDVVAAIPSLVRG